MGSLLSHSVEIQISNNTQNITLKNPRTYFGLGCCSKPPLPELSPGSSDTCSFWGAPLLWGLAGTTGVKGILVYEVKSFTLAIYFYNPIDHDQFSTELGLELSPGKAHLGDLRATYSCMAKGTYSNSNQGIKFTLVIVAGSHGTAQLSHGPVKLMATMSKTTSSTIKVVLEEQKKSGEGAKTKKPQDVKGDRSKRSDILQDLRDILDHPDSSETALEPWRHHQNPGDTSGTP